MLTISHENEGYKLKFSFPGTGTRGYSVHARDMDEVHEAIDHHYMHNDHYKREPAYNCPLCRLVQRKKGGK